MSKPKSLHMQHGGDHYLTRGIQPVEFWASNMWDPFSASILKYMTRWRQKGGVLDLQKALHFANFRVDLDAAHPYPILVEAGRGIAMREYVKANGIPAVEEPIFYALELWVQAGRTAREKYEGRTFIKMLTQYIEGQEIGLPKAMELG